MTLTTANIAPPHQPAPAVLFGKPAPQQEQTGNATIHLCAAAYLDPEFRERAVSEVYARRDRAIAPNPGTDAVPVLRHVRRARAIDLTQDATLTALLVAMLAMPSVNRFALLASLGAWLLISLRLRDVAADRRIASTVRPETEAEKQPTWIERHLTWRKLVLLAAGLLVFLWLDLRLAPTPVPTAACLALVGAVCALFEWIRVHCLSRVPKDLQSTLRTGRRIAYIGEAQHSEVIARPRDDSGLRFPGFGSHPGGMPFSMALRPAPPTEPGKTAEKLPFTVADLHRRLRRRTESLSEDTDATRGLLTLEVTDQYFVSDRYITAPVLKFADLPESVRRHRPSETIADHPDTPVRKHLRCQVSTQDDEVVANLFMYFALQGETLYMRLDQCVLPPTRKEYHVFRDGRLHYKRASIWSGACAAAVAPIEVLWAPVALLLALLRNIKLQFAARPALRGWRPVDCGARIGIRELGYDHDHLNRDTSDALQALHILHQQTLVALKEFLQERNIDTSALDDHMTAVVNYGVINNGEMNTGAAGAGAQVTAGSIGSNSTGTVQQT